MNNAGNMRPVGKSTGFQSFATPQDGVMAMLNDLNIKVSGRSDAMKRNYGENYTPTLRTVISTWAPPKENDTNNYVNFVAQKSGIDPDQPLSTQDVTKFAPHMITMEHGPKAAEKFKQYVQADNGIMSDANTTVQEPDYSQMSDEELMKIVGVQSQELDYSKMSDEELMKLVGTSPPEQSYGERSQSIANQGFSQLGSSFKNLMADHVGDTDYSPVEDLMGMAGGVTNAFLAPITAAVAGGTRPLAKVIGGPEAQKQMAAGDYSQADAIAQDITNLGAVSVPIVRSALKDKNIPNAIINKVSPLIVDESSKGVSLSRQKPPSYDPYKIHEAIGDTYAAAKTKASKFYDFSESVARGKPIEGASSFGKSLDNIMDEIGQDPFHPGRSQLPKLRAFSEKIKAGEFDLADGIELQRTINGHFNPSAFAQKGIDTPYLRLGKSLSKSLGKSFEIYPEVGWSKDLADKNWLNTVANPFEKNKVLQKAWKPEDYYAQKSLKDGLMEELPDATKQRAEMMLSKINDPVQLNAIRRVIPEDLAKSLSKAKIKALNKEKGYGRISSAGRAVAGLPNLTPTGMANTVRNIAGVIKPQLTEVDYALIKAAKSRPPILPSKYSPQLEELKDYIGKDRVSMLGPKRIGGPSKQLSLPPPQRPMVDEGGVLRPMTDDELTLHRLPSAEQAKRVQRAPVIAPIKESEQALAAKKALEEWNKLPPKNRPPKPESPPKIPDQSPELKQITARKRAMEEWDDNYRKFSKAGYTDLEIKNKIGARPSLPEKFSKGGPVRKNLTAEFLATRKRA